MYEWRIFKQLPFTKLDDFEKYVKEWKHAQKYQVDKRTDAYIMISNKGKEMSEFCLKLRGAKLQCHVIKSKLKANMVELKLMKKKLDEQFEQYQVLCKKKKKVKLHIWSESLLTTYCSKQHFEQFFKKGTSKTQEQLSFKFSDDLRQSVKVSSKKRNSSLNIKLLKRSDHLILDEAYQHGVIPDFAQKSVCQLNPQSLYIKEESPEQEPILMCDSKELKTIVLETIETCNSVMIKNKLISSSSQAYLSLLTEEISKNGVYLVVLDKFIAKGDNLEESLIRIRIIADRFVAKSMQNQFYLTCYCENYHPQFALNDILVKKWKDSYGLNIKQLDLASIGTDLFIGGYQEFLSRYTQV